MRLRAIRDLSGLRAAFPGYDFTEDERTTPHRYHAVAREPGIQPYAVITDDLSELAELLMTHEPRTA